MPGHLGKYELLAKIGDGGMATVHRGRLTAAGGAVKQVALKLIHPHLNRERAFLEMFFDEMRVAMAMTHRNIVQTFDAGEQQGQHFLVMELVDGCSLRALLDDLGDQRLPVDIALFVAMELCAALDYAHHFDSGGGLGGVVHRDISPSNVLLSEQGDVKLADFGVARAAGQLTVSSADLIKGKLSYMAPEQARGQVEPRSDLFSLGAVLFEMLSGRPLRPQADLQLVREGHTNLSPVSALRRGLPDALDRLLRSCLAPQPQGRPATAFELRERLGQIFDLIERQTGPARDPHARLRIFLAERLDRVRATRAPASPDPRAANLARAMLQQALEVPTDVGSAPATLSARPLAGGDTAPDLPLESIDTEERTTTSPRASVTAPHAVRGVAPPDDHAVTLKEHPALAPIASLASISAMVRHPRDRWRLLLGLVLGGLAAVGVALLVALLDAGHAPTPPPPATEQPQAPPEVRLVEVLPAEGEAQPPQAVTADRAATTSVAADPGVEPATQPTATPATTPPPPRVPPVTTKGVTGQRAAADRRETDEQPATRPAPPPTKPGRLDINAVPWARVYVDGKFRGETPVQNLILRPGRHALRLINPKRGLSRELVVRLRPGQRLKKVIQLR